MIHQLLSMMRFARVKRVDDSGVIPRLQVFEGSLGAYGGDRLIDKVPHILQFGLISVPPLDAEVLLVALAGDRTQTVAIGSNHQPSRPTGNQPGDSGLYDIRGAKVTLTQAGVTIDAAGRKVVIRNASKVRVESALVEVTGDVVAQADGTRVSLTALHDAYNAHVHGNVAAGSAKTATTDHPA